MSPSEERLLLELYRIRGHIADYNELIERHRIKEKVILDELMARGFNLDKEMARALERMLDSF
jgi:hypothetical protein